MKLQGFITDFILSLFYFFSKLDLYEAETGYQSVGKLLNIKIKMLLKNRKCDKQLMLTFVSFDFFYHYFKFNKRRETSRYLPTQV